MSDHPPRPVSRSRNPGIAVGLIAGAGVAAALAWNHSPPGSPWWELIAFLLFAISVFSLLDRPGSTDRSNQSRTSPTFVSPAAALYEQLKDDPNNPVLLLKLARVEKQRGNLRQAEKAYRKCIHALWALGEQGVAAVVFEEFFVNFGKVFCGPIQLRLARELALSGKHELAALSLEAFIRGAEVCPGLVKEPLLLPQAYVALGRIMAEKLDRPDAARRVFDEFMTRYPEGNGREMVAAGLKLVSAGR